jgi:hypothetical protein
MGVQRALIDLNMNNIESLQILCTYKHLSAIKHANFIRRQLKTILKLYVFLFFLADDDLLAPKKNIEEYLRLLRFGSLYHVGMGRFASFSEQQSHKILERQHLLPGETVSPQEFLLRNENGHLFTCISSMIVPHFVFRDCISFMLFWGSAGRRTEYIWATHRSVQKLVCPRSVTAFVRQHPLQQGSILSINSSLHDEMIYVVWAWFNQPALVIFDSGIILETFTIKRFINMAKELLRRQLSSFPVSQSLVHLMRVIRSRYGS